jgi:hypothetical protein
MYFHWQNLNEKQGGRLGSPLKWGRAWLGSFGVEWVTGRLGLGLSFEQDQEKVMWHVSLPLLTLYISFEQFRGRVKHRELSFRVSDWAIWWRLWADPWSWEHDRPKWRDGSFHLDDFILGKRCYSEQTISEVETVVPMPERAYPATVRLFLSTWSRPRWFATELVRADVKVDGGIPYPGKGENSWDMGDDATYGLMCPARTVEEAVAAMVEAVLSSRRKYGGSVNWQPVV